MSPPCPAAPSRRGDSRLRREALLPRTAGSLPEGLPAVGRHGATRSCTGHECKRHSTGTFPFLQRKKPFLRCKNQTRHEGKSASGFPGKLKEVYGASKLRGITAAFPPFLEIVLMPQKSVCESITSILRLNISLPSFLVWDRMRISNKSTLQQNTNCLENWPWRIADPSAEWKEEMKSFPGEGY